MRKRSLRTRKSYSNSPLSPCARKIRRARLGRPYLFDRKKRNRGKVPQNDDEVRLGIVDLMKSAVGKFNGLPLVVFVELDLPPIEGDPMKKPWIKELMESHEKAGVRDTDGKDFFNSIVFTNSSAKNPQIAHG